MPRGWIPFRGDDDSKENSKRYLPGKISVGTRVFGTAAFILISGLFLFVFVIGYIKEKSGFSIFGLTMAGIIILIAMVAFVDARKIASKNRKKSDE